MQLRHNFMTQSAMRQFRRIPLYILALLFLFEAWLWDLFRALGDQLARIIPLERFKAWISGQIQRLPPYAALCLFCIPVLVIFPFKVAALWLIAKGHVVFGGCAFFAAKVTGLGVTAFLYNLTSEKLMTLDWFRRLYALVMSWRDWAHRLVDPYKQQLADFMRAQREWALRLIGERNQGPSFNRLVVRLRQRIRRRFS
jgi:hypothetical protein